MGVLASNANERKTIEMTAQTLLTPDLISGIVI